MNLQHLKVFAAVAKYKKMNIAAEKLYLTESAVSQTISRLERQYGVELFERLNKSIYLTPAGEGLLFYAQQMLDFDREATEYLENLQAAHRLRIGGAGIMPSEFLKDVIDELRVFDEKSELILYNHTPTYTLTLIRSNRLDIAFVSDAIVSVIDSDFILTPILKEKGILICGQEHPFYGRPSVTLEELRDQPFIVSDETGGFSTTLESCLMKNNIPVNVRGHCNDAVARKNMIYHLPYLAFSSYGLCKDDIESGLLHAIRLEGVSFEQNYCLLHHKDKHLSPLLSQFIHVCTDDIPFQQESPF